MVPKIKHHGTCTHKKKQEWPPPQANCTTNKATNPQHCLECPSPEEATPSPNWMGNLSTHAFWIEQCLDPIVSHTGI
jgi:hypothetical protein